MMRDAYLADPDPERYDPRMYVAEIRAVFPTQVRSEAPPPEGLRVRTSIRGGRCTAAGPGWNGSPILSAAGWPLPPTQSTRTRATRRSRRPARQTIEARSNTIVNCWRPAATFPAGYGVLAGALSSVPNTWKQSEGWRRCGQSAGPCIRCRVVERGSNLDQTPVMCPSRWRGPCSEQWHPLYAVRPAAVDRGLAFDFVKNRPGFHGGSQSTEDEGRGCTEEVPGRAA